MYDLRALQLTELELLKEVDRICSKHRLTYFLVQGTLIGAIRHKGFIPWDDDIDIAMPFIDYCKFEEVCKNDLYDLYFLQTEKTQPETGLTYNKLRKNNTTLIIDTLSNRDIHHGVSIDIYPLYNLPNGKIAQKIQYISTMLYSALQVQQAPKNHGKLSAVLVNLLLLIFKGTSRIKMKDFFHKYMARYRDKKTNYRGFLFSGTFYAKHVYPASYFNNTTKIMFEDSLFPCPVGYDDYLRKLYGDYMKLPPVEEQGVKLNHILKMDLETSYETYRGELYCKSE